MAGLAGIHSGRPHHIAPPAPARVVFTSARPKGWSTHRSYTVALRPTHAAQRAAARAFIVGRAPGHTGRACFWRDHHLHQCCGETGRPSLEQVAQVDATGYVRPKCSSLPAGTCAISDGGRTFESFTPGSWASSVLSSACSRRGARIGRHTCSDVSARSFIVLPVAGRRARWTNASGTVPLAGFRL